eukprot:1949499-Prymnesium_polylepis.1
MGSVGSGSLSLTVGAQVSNTLITATSDAFAVTTNTSLDASFGSGAIWQWQYVVPPNECGNASVFTKHLRVTPDPNVPPCCLPGYEQSISAAHGKCRASEDGIVYNVCPEEADNTAPTNTVP